MLQVAEKIACYMVFAKRGEVFQGDSTSPLNCY